MSRRFRDGQTQAPTGTPVRRAIQE